MSFDQQVGHWLVDVICREMLAKTGGRAPVGTLIPPEDVVAAVVGAIESAGFTVVSNTELRSASISEPELMTMIDGLGDAIALIAAQQHRAARACGLITAADPPNVYPPIHSR